MEIKSAARFLLLLFFFSAPFAQGFCADAPLSSGPSDILIVSGIVKNLQGRPVKDAELAFFLNDLRLEQGRNVSTNGQGIYLARIALPAGTLPGGKLEVEAARANFKTSARIPLGKAVKEGVDKRGNVTYLAYLDLTLARHITAAFWIAASILIAVYALIAFELMHRTLAAFLGAALLLAITYTIGAFNGNFAILSFADAMSAIDMNVIFLLMAMMIIVGVLKKTGVFQWMAYKSYQLARGNVIALASILMFVTAILSAFLDNVTTMLLIIPVSIEIALTLKLNPITLLLPETFASNVGGTATLIGDPPNIMIGSFARLSFLDFIEHLGLVSMIALAISIVYFLFWFKRDYAKAGACEVSKLIDRLREEYKITNKVLLIQGSVILGITIFLFIIHGTLKMEPSIAAMVGAAILMVVSRVDIVEILEQEIEWPTLIFFMMLFIVVAGAEEAGLIQVIADGVRELSRGSPVVAVLLILWVSALASAIIDNIPFTATMLPVVSYLTATIPGAQSEVLWWALSLGACLGGNGTMIGASANVVTVGMAERAGFPVSFMEYVKIAFAPMVITLVLCSVWLLAVEM